MTLRQLLIHLDLRVPHPEVLGKMEIEGFSFKNPIYCTLRMKQYLGSKYFQEDMERLQSYLQEMINHGYDPSDFMLFVERDNNHGYNFDLDHVCIELGENQ